MHSPVETPEEAVTGEERIQKHQDMLRRLPQALEQLDLENKTLLRMRFYLDISFVSIAVALGISEPTARRRVANALRNLNGELQKQRSAS